MWWAAAPATPFSHQVSDIAIRGGKYQCQDPAVIVKSCNSDILMDGVQIDSACDVLIKSRTMTILALPTPRAGRSTAFM